MPFTRREIDALLQTCDDLEVKALVLLLRYSGLRIGDAVSLSSDLLHDGKLMLRTAKTGVVVYVPLPDFVIAALEAVKRMNGYFFWSGSSRKSSVTDTWRKRLAPAFKAAGIAHGHPHRFRDTFAVELLLSGVPLERVSRLLGHSTTRITEKHYSPWVADRQRQLEEDVRRAWNFPEPGTKGTQEGHGKSLLVN
jgi:integrase